MFPQRPLLKGSLKTESEDKEQLRHSLPLLRLQAGHKGKRGTEWHHLFIY